jgi:polyribonucleotide nucleotidyltransferase
MKEDFRSIEFAPGKTISVETGRIAKLADGAVMVKMGDTMVLCTVVSAREIKTGQDFFPLVVDLRESFTAGGKFPGGFMKREGRPSDGETLASRLIDRSLRPLFPDGYYNETQVICQVYSSDGQNEADVLGAFGASAAIHISDIPYDGPMAQVKVGRINGEFVINPTIDELKKSDMDMIVAGTKTSVIMIEGEMKEISEKEMVDAIKEGHKAIINLCEFQDELRKEFGVEKREFIPVEVNEELKAKVEEIAGSKIKDILETGLGKEEYNGRLRELKDQVIDELTALDEYEEAAVEISDFFGKIEKRELRNMILEKNEESMAGLRKISGIYGRR